MSRVFGCPTARACTCLEGNTGIRLCLYRVFMQTSCKRACLRGKYGNWLGPTAEVGAYLGRQVSLEYADRTAHALLAMVPALSMNPCVTTSPRGELPRASFCVLWRSQGGSNRTTSRGTICSSSLLGFDCTIRTGSSVPVSGIVLSANLREQFGCSRLGIVELLAAGTNCATAVSDLFGQAPPPQNSRCCRM